MNNKITKMMSLLSTVESRNDAGLINIGLIMQELKNDMVISNKARSLATDAIDVIDTLMNGRSDFNREIKKLSRITEEMSFSYSENTWKKKKTEIIENMKMAKIKCDICNANPFLAKEFLKELDKNVDQIRSVLLRLKLEPNDNNLLRLCYKSFHTLNGVAGYLDLKYLQILLQATEKLILEDLQPNNSINNESFDLLFFAFGNIKDYLKNWEKRGDCVIIIPEGLFKTTDVINYTISSKREHGILECTS